jgi:hypothetical protein
LVRWDQYDNYLGLQAIRGLNGDPPKVARVGVKTWQVEPGVFGEFVPLDEQELTTRRRAGTFGEPISLDDLVAKAHEQLLQRELDRVEKIGWDLVSTGTYSVSNLYNQVTQVDTFPIQTFTSSPTWTTFATATPLADFRAVKLLARGYSVSFGAGATAYMNQSTLNNMLSNTNNNDLAGRRVAGLLSVLNLEEVNRILLGEDLPQVAPYDLFYRDDTTAVQLFIPNGKVVVIGKRPNNEPVAEYVFTRNVNNADLGPGPYTLVEDSIQYNRPPRQVSVHRGHNGAPAIYYPSAICSMTVY